MGTSQVPALIDALVTQAQAALTASGVSVYDGFGVSGDPGDFLMIGVEDPNLTSSAFSAQAEQVPGPMGTNRPRDEHGTVNCAAYSWNGNANQKQARDAVYAISTAVENLLRTDPGLGIAAGGLFVAEMGTTQGLSQNQDSAGADALLIFQVHFKARI